MKKNREVGQHVYRLVPCSEYDIAGIETWLSDLSEEGLFLTQDGITAGIAAFEYQEPQRMRYRLEAAQKSTSMWANDGGDPDPEQVELGRKYSWEYIAKLKNFYIYRSSDSHTREWNTDPQVQALALNSVKRRLRGEVLSTLFLLVVYPIVLTRGCLLLTVIQLGEVWSLLLLVFLLLLLIDDVRAFLHLKKVQNALRADGYDPSEGSWKEKKRSYLSRKIFKLSLGIFLVFAFLRTWGIALTKENAVSLDAYEGSLPFASMQDFAGEGSLEYRQRMTGLSSGFNTIEERRGFLAPVSISYNEHAMVKKADGSWIEGGLYVEYHEMRNSSLAKILSQELLRTDKSKKRFEWMETPNVEADYVVAYMDNLHFPTVIIRKGNLCIRAYFFQTTDTNIMPLEEWAGVVSDSLGNNNNQ